MLVLRALALAVAHAPGFRPSGRTHTFDDSQLSQVEYRGPGEHTFVFPCAAGETVFWEVVTPWPTVYSPKVTADYAAMAAVPALSQSPTPGCPIKRYREGFTATQIATMARFGSVNCSAGAHAVTVESAGSVAFVIGEEEVLSEIQLWKMPWYYVRVGAWAGWGCPWTLITVVLLIMWWGWGWNAHRAIGIVWVLFLLDDFLRFWYTAAGSVDDVCTGSPDDAKGPESHSDGSGASTAVGLYALRLFVVGLSIALLQLHQDGYNRWAITATAAAAAVGGWFLGVGTGIWGIVVALYYACDRPADPPPAYKKVSLIVPSL